MKRLTALILAVAMFFCGCSYFDVKKETVNNTNYTPVIENDGFSHYGYDCLDTPAQRTAYDRVLNAVLALKEEVVTDLVTMDEAGKVITYLLADNPLVFYIGSKYSYSQKDDKAVIKLRYISDSKDILNKVEKIKKSRDEIVKGIDLSLPDFDKTRIVYDRLLKTTEYGGEQDSANRLYSSLVDKKALCGGYAKGFQYLLESVGVDALLVYGNSRSPHAWNMVKLDGNYYIADSTWDDTAMDSSGKGKYVSHGYFLLGLGQDNEHIPFSDGQNYPLPDLDSVKNSYFVKTDTYVKTKDDVKGALSNALNIALSNDNQPVEIMFNQSMKADIEKKLEDIDKTMIDICKERYIKAKDIKRVYNDKNYVLSYLLDEQ